MNVDRLDNRSFLLQTACWKVRDEVRLRLPLLLLRWGCRCFQLAERGWRLIRRVRAAATGWPWLAGYMAI